MSERFAWINPFVSQLIKLAEPDNRDRAVLAHLRRGLGQTSDHTIARVGWLFRGIDDDRELDAAILAAGLFAWVKGDCPQNNGASFGRAFGWGLSDEEKSQREKRFTDLLDTDIDDLPYKLRQAVTLMARTGTGLDWGMLIKHLVHWDHPDRWVQKDWARGFWANPKADEEQADKATVNA